MPSSCGRAAQDLVEGSCDTLAGSRAAVALAGSETQGVQRVPDDLVERGTCLEPTVNMTSTRTDLSLTVAAALVAITATLSGPLGFVVTLVRQQPPWTDVPTFSAHAHPIQQLPFWVGFFLLAACVMFIARLCALGFEQHRTRAFIALVCVAIYGAMIAINYALQIAFVPYAARTLDPALGYVTMSRGGTPTWVLEMFGYGVLGIATAIAAPMVESGNARRTWIRRLLVANGAVSVAGAIACAVDLAWVTSLGGLASFFGWNLLFIATMVMIVLEYRPRASMAASLTSAALPPDRAGRAA
jgi:hypothetical protein